MMFWSISGYLKRVMRRRKKKSLCCAIIKDYPDEAIFELIRNSPVNVNEIDKDGTTALMWAIKKERTRVMLKIIERGVYINRANGSGYTALHYAVETGNLIMCQYLIGRGSSINATTNAFNHTPLHLACKYNQTDIVELLISCGANRNALDYDNTKPEAYLEEPLNPLEKCKRAYAQSFESISLNEMSQLNIQSGNLTSRSSYSNSAIGASNSKSANSEIANKWNAKVKFYQSSSLFKRFQLKSKILPFD